jgi:hypothetical protein
LTGGGQRSGLMIALSAPWRANAKGHAISHKGLAGV